MYDFWFNQITKDSPCEFDLGMSDTDSLLFKVTKPQIFWEKMDPHMDYSNYDPSHPKFSLENKAMLGKFKNELGSEKKCVRFVGLRAKCYSLKLVDRKKSESEKDFIKKQAAAVGVLDLADPAFAGAGEGVGLVAENLAFEQVFRQAAAVEGDELLAFAPAEVVQAARDQFLASAGFALDQHIG